MGTSLKPLVLEALADADFYELKKLIYTQEPSYFVSQNITNQGIYLFLSSENQTFYDNLDFCTTGFLILTSDIPSVKRDKIYIVNKGNNTNNPFVHFNQKRNDPLTVYQTYLYYLIINFPYFIKRLEIISNLLLEKGDKAYRTIISLVSSYFVFLNLFLYILINAIIYFYLQKYYKILGNLYQEIENRLNLKNDEISVREMMLSKVEKLKIIIILYKQDLLQKKKEMNNYMKKEKYFGFNVNNYYSAQKKLEKTIIRYINNSKYNRKHIYYILGSTIFFILLTLGIRIVWISYNKIYRYFSHVIDSLALISGDMYKSPNYLLLMILNNITIDDINELEGIDSSNGDNYFSNLYLHLNEVYEAAKYLPKVSQYDIGDLNSYFNHTCLSFYSELYKSNEFLKNFPHDHSLIISTCEKENLFKVKNYKQIFSIYFEYLQLAVNNIQKREYKDLFSNLQYVSKFFYIYILFYSHLLEILGRGVQSMSFEKISSLVIIYINISYIIYYISSVIFILFIIFEYVLKINNFYNRMDAVKKVFKVCNKNES